jgi:hypothetical protein
MSAAEAASDPKSRRAGGLLGLVRQLIDYGRQLAATLRSNPHLFGASDIALILARITRGLLRAEALEARIIRTAATLDADPSPPRASHRQAPPARGTAARPTDAADSSSALVPAPGLDPGVDPMISLPTPAQIAAEVRRRPIGAVIADICRDLGILPSHPLWRELQHAIIRYDGSLANLVEDFLDRAFQRPAPAWPFTPLPAPALQSPAPAGTGPP